MVASDRRSSAAGSTLRQAQGPWTGGYFVRARMKVETEVSMPKRESHMEVELAKKEFRAWTFLGST